MTRRGSLAYYLVAWVCGCLFMSLAIWLPGQWEHTHWTPGFQGASGFLFFYFLGLILGAFTALLFAFLLRRLVAALRLKDLWQWALTGAGLAELLVWGLAGLNSVFGSSRFALGMPRPLELLRILLVGALGAVRPPAVRSILAAGAATASVLHLIQRAFEPRADQR
jgi:uncharacterized membrane protein